MTKPISRRTKIVATLGPATDDRAILEQLICAGVDLVRFNFSHGSHDDHRRRAQWVRDLAQAHGRVVGILADLQGPKIRTQRFVDGQVLLTDGASFCLDINHPKEEGTVERVGVTYQALPQDVEPGAVLLLDDGRISMEVVRIDGGAVHCRVLIGGVLKNNKGINRQGGGLTAPALTEKDRADIPVIAEIDADYMAVSFPRTGADMQLARELLTAEGGKAQLVAKVERAEAVEAIDDVIAHSDAVMVARGDLGVEIGDAELPGVQKRIIRKARASDKLVITATQMMESMIENPIPTRAEVMDVANAVIDGTDAVMTSGETAAGKYPVKVIKAMHRICIGAETQHDAKIMDHRGTLQFDRVDESIAMAAMYVANRLNIRAIIALTESGSTPLWMSRTSSVAPIYALTRIERTSRKMTLFRGVYPVPFDPVSRDHAKVNMDAVQLLIDRGCVDEGDLVIITKGDLQGVHGGTNAMKIATVGRMVDPE